MAAGVYLKITWYLSVDWQISSYFQVHASRHFEPDVYHIPSDKINKNLQWIDKTTKDCATIHPLEKSVGTRTDGDTTDDLPVELSVVSKGLAVYSPKKEEQA